MHGVLIFPQSFQSSLASFTLALYMSNGFGLRPQESRAYSKPGSKQDSVKLVIELNTNYPKEKPQSLKVVGDLPEASKSKLNEILNTLSEEKSKQGKVYLHDLCVFTQERRSSV